MREIHAIISSAKEALEQNRPGEALALLDQIPSPNDPDTIFLKGEICFRLQKWGEALNHFFNYLELVPSDKRAVSYTQMIQNILGFYHKDLYNP